MRTLHIDLQTGFEDDAVTITVDGDTVYDDTEVTTSLLTGSADSFQVTVESGTHQVQIQLPDRAITDSISVEIEKEVYLGISVEDGEVVFRLSEEPFGYM